MVIEACIPKKVRRDYVVKSISIDKDILNKLYVWMQEHGKGNISEVVESFIACGVRDSCEGCPSFERLAEEEKVKITGKVGVGKQVIRDEDEG